MLSHSSAGAWCAGRFLCTTSYLFDRGSSFAKMVTELPTSSLHSVIASTTAPRTSESPAATTSTPLPTTSQTQANGSTSAKEPALHEDIYTIPNFLTFTRLVAAPVVGYLVLHDQHAWAVGLFAYAGVTDLLDGWIARRWNRKTVVGTIIDPMADKALMTILTVCLAVKGALPLWVATIILGRDVGLGFAAIYYRWISLPPPKTFTRYWDFSLPSAEVHPTTISKYNTFLQLALVGLTTSAPLVGVDLGLALTSLQYIVAGTTIWSGASYIFTKDAVKILNKAKSQGKGE
ncbi:CDP-alcohol phosphatidyltransferase class-I family protein [Paramyrothecium foliicola]|nr:CDP-alcohol phosphatidyltransferase class-I family protein [Paramyrothecium foliicola]